MEEIRYRTVTFFYSLIAAIVILQLIQWSLGMFDWHIAYPYNRIAAVLMTILFWSPWVKPNLPKNQGNNDLFPG